MKRAIAFFSFLILMIAPALAFAATLGNTSIGGTDCVGGTTIIGTPVTTSVAGTSTSLSAYLSGLGDSSLIRVGLYSDSSFSPNSLLIQSSLQSSTPNAWNSVPLVYSLQASTTYWLAFVTNDSSNVTPCVYDSGGYFVDGSVSGATLPDPFPFSASTTVTMSEYLTYTPESSSSPSSTVSSTSYYDPYQFEDFYTDFIWGLISATITAPFFMINSMRKRKRSTNNKTT